MTMLMRLGYNLPQSDVDIEEARKMFDVNFFGVIRVTKAFIPLIIAAKGKIINNSSVAGVTTLPFQGIYNASKAAISSITRTLRLEMKPFGVQVVDLHTGLVKTRFFENLPDPTLPENSIWLPAKEHIANQINELATNGEPAEDWAKIVVNKTIGKTTATDVWAGGDALMIWFITSIFPKRFVDWLIYSLRTKKAAKAVSS
jgi:1-acylglycerone phosphate reductase